MSIFLNAALQYAKFGFSVIPISPGQKNPPLIPFKEYQTRCATPEEIAEWWIKWPDANVGIITGKISDLTVVDLDKYKTEYDPTIEEEFFGSIETPTAVSPREGQHLYFTYCEGITVRSNVFPAIDIRGEGGYIVAPPSINGTGKPYKWIIGLEQNRAALPASFLASHSNIYNSLIKNNNINNYNYINKGMGEGVNSPLTELKTVNFDLNEGSRDQTLFHIANCLIKGGATTGEAFKVLEILADKCKPRFPQKEILTKINSVLSRVERKERNLSRELEDYVLLTNGYFSVNSCYSVLTIVKKEDKTTVRVVLNKLKKNGMIEKHPTQDGVYRRVETADLNFITFDENEIEEVEYPVVLPLGINDIAEISQGNIILVAGEFNAGKTSFMFNVLRDNKGKIPIRYITSEMTKSEMKKKFASFSVPLRFWIQDEMTEYIRKSVDFHTAIRPDALNIIDYLEFHESDYTKGAEYLTKIHDQLTTGIAIVAVQKKEGTRMPRSGDMIVEKPRLAITLSKKECNSEYPQGIASILKCKMPKIGKVDGKSLRFELQRQGSKFNVLNDWGYWKW
jgi:hypothetical protein